MGTEISASSASSADRQSEPVTLQMLMGEQLKAAGVKVDYRNSESLVHQYGELMRASGVSTKSFSDVNVFSPIIDKQMRYKYDRLESIWTKLYRKRTVVDFKDVATVDFDTLGRAKLLAENEDYPEVLLKSSGGLFKVSKIGVTAAISFESQINEAKTLPDCWRDSETARKNVPAKGSPGYRPNVVWRWWT